MLVLSLSAPASVAVGAPVSIRVALENRSGQAIWVVGVLDGSEAGARFPHYLPTISGPPGVPEPPPPWCGMLMPLRLQEFQLLQAGKQFDPTQATAEASFVPITIFTNFRASQPGRYSFHLTFSTLSQGDDAWLGAAGGSEEAAVRRRIAQVPRMQIVAQPVIVEVKA